MTVKRPEPIAELIVKKSVGLTSVFDITTVTEDARQWIMTEAARYGTLFEESRKEGVFTLFVSDAYKPDEVGNWLRDGYGQS